MNPIPKDIRNVSQASKLFLKIFLPVLFSISLVLYIYYDHAYQLESRGLETYERNRLERHRKIISDMFKSAVADLRALSEDHELHEYLSSKNAVNKAQLTADWMDFSQRAAIYEDICYLNAKGMEVFCIKNNAGVPHVVSAENLKDRSGEGYFINSIAMPENDYFISHLSLNVWHDLSGSSYVPSIMLSAPYVDKNAKTIGVISLNLRSNALHNILRNDTHSLTQDIPHFKEYRYWLIGPHRQSDIEDYCDLRKLDDPGLPISWQSISQDGYGQFANESGLITFVSPAISTGLGIKESEAIDNAASQGATHTWKIISFVPERIFKAMLTPLRKDSILLFAFSSTIAALLVWSYSYASTLKRKAAQENAHARKEWEKTFDAIADPVMIISRDFRILKANKAMYDKLQLPAGDITGDYCYEHLHRSGGPHTDCPHVNLLTSGMPHTSEIFEQQSNEYYLVSVSPMFDDHGTLLGSVHYARDITHQKQAELALRKSETSLASAQRLASVGNWDWNIAKDELHWSAEVYRILGLDPATTAPGYDSFLNAIHPEDRDAVDEAVKAALNDNILYNIDHRIVRSNGTVRIVNEQGTVKMDSQGKPVAMMGTIQDITERKEMEERIRESLYEKEMLIKEVHHRIKNNLSIVQSLLGLQSRMITDVQAREYFQESQDRIRAMALIHEKIYSAGDLDSVNCFDYISTLVSQLIKTYAYASRIQFRLDVPDIRLNVNTIIPCGLLLNELISNAIKHAFGNTHEGIISIGLACKDDNTYVLTVKDNGTGIPADMDIFKSKTLGMMIIVSQVKQLDGKMEIVRSAGTEFTIEFGIIHNHTNREHEHLPNS